MKKNELPKLVSSDIGGTLIGGSNMMPSFTVNVLNHLVKHHVPVALITGYNYKTTLRYARNLDEKILLLPQNGTLCLRERKLVWEYRIPETEALEIFKYLDEKELPIIIYKGRNEGFMNYYISRNEITSLEYAFQRLERLDSFENITGISTLLPDEMALKVRDVIASILGERFKVIYTREAKTRGSWLEVVHADVRKDLAIKRLCEELSVSLSDVVYFGDNFNDLEVLRQVGYPVLVENAAPELKNEFLTIISSVDSEGVAFYLKELFHLKLHPSN
jgi:5-amino-6-(5-phospho-D-ribitylamino)uracil phosphatase